MAYTDEEILKAKKARQQEEQKQYEQEKLEKEKAESIFDGSVHIYGRKTAFSRRVIGEYGISIYMPEEFEELDNEIKKLVFPFAHPPRYVFASGETQFQITLNLTDNVVPDSGMPKFMKTAKALMERMGPQTRILSCATVQKQGHSIGIMEVSTRAVDMNVYNVMFYLSVNQKLLTGSVLCPAKCHERMVPIAKEMIDSVEREDSDGNNNIS